jgi:hypothetical protein
VEERKSLWNSEIVYLFFIVALGNVNGGCMCCLSNLDFSPFKLILCVNYITYKNLNKEIKGITEKKERTNKQKKKNEWKKGKGRQKKETKFERTKIKRMNKQKKLEKRERTME